MGETFRQPAASVCWRTIKRSGLRTRTSHQQEHGSGRISCGQRFVRTNDTCISPQNSGPRNSPQTPSPRFLCSPSRYTPSAGRCARLLLLKKTKTTLALETQIHLERGARKTIGAIKAGRRQIDTPAPLVQVLYPTRNGNKINKELPWRARQEHKHRPSVAGGVRRRRNGAPHQKSCVAKGQTPQQSNTMSTPFPPPTHAVHLTVCRAISGSPLYPCR